MTPPMTHLPPDDAPLSEWLRPLSATLDTRPHARWFATLPPPEVATRETQPPSHQTCPYPGCGKQLQPRNASGMCARHSHAVGYCRCKFCRGEDG